MTFPEQSVHSRRLARLTSAAVGIIGAALVLGGCDSDGAGVEDAGSKDKVDTALSSSLERSNTQPVQGSSGDIAATLASPDVQSDSGNQPVESIGFGSYQVPLGTNMLLCTFAENPATEGFAWACEAPIHLGWTATAGGEANAVSYRPGAHPEILALLGNSGMTTQGALSAGLHYSIGGRYSVDTTATDALIITDLSTGVSVRLADGGYTRL